MLSRFHKSEFFLSISLIVLSLLFHVLYSFTEHHLQTHTLDINVYDTYYILTFDFVQSLVTYFGLGFGFILLGLSYKVFPTQTKEYYLLLILFVTGILGLYYQFAHYRVADIPKRLFTNSIPNSVYLKLLIAFIVVLIFLIFLKILVIKFSKFRLSV